MKRFGTIVKLDFKLHVVLVAWLGRYNNLKTNKILLSVILFLYRWMQVEIDA